MVDLELLHPVLKGESSPRVGTPLAEARLSDRQRLAVLLEGAALLSHLRQAGRHLPLDWEGAQIGRSGRLEVGAWARGTGRTAQEQLQDLVTLLFRSVLGVRGRGEARRAVRLLEGAWVGNLSPLSPDAAVAHVFEAAPFLWEPPFGESRRALAARLTNGGETRLWVAGPPGFRDRLLTRSGSLEELGVVLASGSAESIWRSNGADGADGEGKGADPARLAATGRFAAALAAWGFVPPMDAAGRCAMASALLASGRAERALDLLADDRSGAARVLRARCQHRLGKLGAARAALSGIEREELSEDDAFAAAEIATRVLANQLADSGTRPGGSVAFWLERADAAARGEVAQLRAQTLFALSAWDRGDLTAMAEILDRCQAANEIPEIAWRWFQARGLERLSVGDGGAAVEALSAALAHGRRRLGRFEAAGLWSDLGLGRAGAGDLAGAERAFQHAARLLAACDGPRRTTLALYNLAEIRIRRGRFGGVREVLEASIAENRSIQNQRGQVHDLELWARWELAHGRAEAALAQIAQARAILVRRRSDWRRQELAVLAARALGWLGRPKEAAAELALGEEAAAGLLEPEELPALWALAGDHLGAREKARGSALDSCWQTALENREIAEQEWSPARSLEASRRARLVFDLEGISCGTTPAEARREGAAWWREVGAPHFAERLEEVDQRALERAARQLLVNPVSSGREVWTSAFAALDRSEARVVLRRAEGEQLVIAGVGGERSVRIPMVGANPLESGEVEILASAVNPEVQFVAACAVLSEIALRSSSNSGEAPSATSARGVVHEERPDSLGILGDSPALLEALRRLDRIASDDMPVLVQGESGTGKELAARRIHRGSRRRRGAFVAVNCAALSETLLLSDLFGHARGSFTGADRERLGVFETAHGGTVFLDEIGDLPLVAQGMLLRVLQEGEVRRLGESAPRKVDVRVIAATHRDLQAMVAAGTFRQDLFFRLRVARIELPPLRERGGDVILLAEHFLARFARHERPQARWSGDGIARLSRAARARLLAHPWPGNVRELENVLRVAIALAERGEIEPEHLEIPEETTRREAVENYHHAVDVYRRQLVEQALVAAGGNRAEAARRLGLTRQALSYLVRQLRLS